MDVLLAAGTTPATTAKVTVAAAAPIALGLLVWGCVQFQVVTIMVRGYSLHPCAYSIDTVALMSFKHDCVCVTCM